MHNASTEPNGGSTKAKKFAIAGVIIGSVFALLGVIQAAHSTSPSDGVASSPAAVENYPNYGRIPHSSAVTFWETRSAERPSDYTSRTHLGAALIGWAGETGQLETYERAEQVLRDALVINEDSTSTRLTLAAALHSQHEFNAARELGEAVAADQPDSLGALLTIGDASFELGDYPRARELYFVVASEERSAPIVSRLARLAWVDGDLDESVNLAAEAVVLSADAALRPNEAAFYWYQLGHYRFERGDLEGAIADFEQALHISAGNLAASEELPFVLAAAGRVDEAMDLYKQLLDGGGAADVHGLYADLLRANGRKSEAAAHEALAAIAAEKTVGRFPAENRHLIGYFLSRDPQRALQLAEDDFSMRQDVESYDALAWALFHNGRYEEASEAIASALINGTNDAEMFYHAAAISHALGADGEARDFLSQALQLNPRFHPIDWTDGHALSIELGS